MRKRGRWPPWLGCNLVWISIKNIIFLHFACVRPFFPLSLDLGDFSFHLCAPLFKLRTPPLFCFCLDSHVIFSHLGSSIHMWFFLILARPVHFVSSSAGCQFFGFPAAPVSRFRFMPRSSLQPRSFWVCVFATQHRAWLVQQQELFQFFWSTPEIHRLQASLCPLRFHVLLPRVQSTAWPRRDMCAAFLGAIFFLVSRERRAKFSSGSHAARVLRLSGRSRLFHFDFLCVCDIWFCGNCCRVKSVSFLN
jgi:hypothetical protein